MENLIKDPHFEKSTLWVLEFNKAGRPNQVDLVFSEEFITNTSFANMTNLEELKRDAEAMRALERLCESLKTECMEEIEKGRSLENSKLSENEINEASEKITQNLENLEGLIKRFFKILKRFNPPEK